ncbi:shematrin-like protein 2 [Haliotis rufescens]|uniref:shematrin-like protein 2 n=1 Tax=Haliotis rufescens TaxID=6454 RepID=UPI001EB02239|nr:shematrin-like protein 2 [Haliotis rufescens]
MKAVIAALSVLVASALAQVPFGVGTVGVAGTGYGYNPYNKNYGYNSYGYGKDVGKVGVAGPFVAGHGVGLVGHGPFVGHAGSFAGNGPFVAGKGHGYGYNTYNGVGNGVGLVGNGLLGHTGYGLAGPLAVVHGVAGQGYRYGYNPYNNNYGYGKNVGHGAGLVGNGFAGHGPFVGHGVTGHGVYEHGGPFVGHGVAGSFVGKASPYYYH